MSIPGYCGMVLHVDLGKGDARREPLDPALVRRLIGGYGINNWLARQVIPPHTDPLSPGNGIILGAGPFTGTLIPGSAKLMATTRFPLNGAFGVASGGGRFAPFLKSAGCDHVVIMGRAARPCYLLIENGGGTLHDAAPLWGRDIFDAADALQERHGPCSAIPIGPSGENLVLDSITSIDKGGTLGRGGLPAVMGAKNLKAIVVRQGCFPVQPAHRNRLLSLVNELHERITLWPGRQAVLEDGALSLPPSMRAEHRRTRRLLACPSCLLADKELVTLDEGEHAGLATCLTHLAPGPFPTAAATYAGSVVYADALNRHGLCRLNFTPLVALLTSLYQQGTITSAQTGGLELRPDLETALKLVGLTARREGLGAVLAGGAAAVIERFGLPPSLLPQSKGLSTVYDPRSAGLGTMEFDQMVNPRGAHVASGGSPSSGPGRPPADFARHAERMGMPPEAVARIVGADSFNVARFARYSEDWFSLFSSLGLCNRWFVNRFYHVNTIAQLYSALTGLDVTPAELMHASERAWNLGKMLNAGEGFGRAADAPPAAWFTPLQRGEESLPLMDYYHRSILGQADMERLLDDYYDERGWDRGAGTPKPQKLAELGLDGLAPW